MAGISVSKNDVVIPPDKEAILEDFEARVATVEGQHARGLITDEERHEIIVNLWTEATDTVATAMEKAIDELNPIFMMANSGARGSFTQIRQLAGMRGLMANPKGEIIERPIKANFMEGLSVLEYFISTHGARKGLADTALRTADSGYLTRRLVDVSQDVIIREDDCKTKEFIELPLHVAGEGVNKSLFGRIVAQDVHNVKKDGSPGREGAAREGHGDRQRRHPRASRRSSPTSRTCASRCARSSSAAAKSESAARATARSSAPASSARSATRSGSWPRSRSASRARS